jgi:hypothetical protein
MGLLGEGNRQVGKGPAEQERPSTGVAEMPFEETIYDPGQVGVGGVKRWLWGCAGGIIRVNSVRCGRVCGISC